jgi:DNA-binding NarL/FixJ family response regulator
MDIRLPGENGLEISRRITSGDWAGTLIILTSYDLPEYRDAAFQSGASYFLTKGTATSNEIVALIESVVSGKNLNSLSRKSPNAMNN